ncbi:S-adenosyl-L-methionine-dependent methyltransferase [Jaminaea rosea]|uniref:DNA (cytosine-5-)-methyltransferase n=1 Tax=Jaminaea rosea TaxID=1569628 RepID=A0A316UWN8_9BASI|nr:S-adenosyl-L-methionine-dependent methyltransferase [Jaminaea rosea]PWN29699.1 S-adenosyl-L-methionine-dependent methyltransferase [Jaminaea rosea]
MNRRRDPEDPRNFLVFSVLSYVEVLRPSYFVLENVEGMISPTMSVGKERQGFLKVLVMTLLELGYGVRVSHVQAARCGAATMRDRIILMASREGLPLPRHPTATNVLPSTTIEKVTLEPTPAAPRQYRCFTDEEFAEGCAPHPALTVASALSDLPIWDWQDPHSAIQETQQDQELARRRKQGIPVYAGDSQRPLIGPRLQSYSSPPKNVFQALMRWGSAGRVTQHQTLRFSSLEIERVVQLPFRRGANHESWASAYVGRPHLTPGRLESQSAFSPAGGSAGGGWGDGTTPMDRAERLRIRDEVRRADRSYRRIEADKPCPMLFTTAAPGAYNGPCIHHNAARALTLRERMRVQGFPDSVSFYGTPDEVQQQVGNAVPVPLGMAIGRCLLESWDSQGSSAGEKSERRGEKRKAGAM